MSDRSNATFRRRLSELTGLRATTDNNPYIRPKALTVDNDHARESFQSLFPYLGIEAVPAENDEEALGYLKSVADTKDALDAITTDIVHPTEGGFSLVERIRNLPDEWLIAGGLRMRHLPIVVMTCCYEQRNIEHFRRIDPTIIMIDKSSPAWIQEITKALDDAICLFRTSVLQELQYVGLSIVWQGGQFSVRQCYLQTAQSVREGKYFAGVDAQISAGYSRLVLLGERLSVAEQSLAELEQLLNTDTTIERDLHEFFGRHPEFLYRQRYASHWSEPVLKGPNVSYRPDFVLKPLTMPENSWEWEVLDLKRHNVALATAHLRHADLSASVHNGCAQLRNYGRFFADPRNREQLLLKFGGIVPQPKLTLVIGRLAGVDSQKIGRLRSTVPDVRILTYDEILAFRRADMERLQWLRQS